MVIALLTTSASAQLYKAEMKAPSAEALSAARKQCMSLFNNLKKGKTEEIAQWMIEEIGYAYSPAEKLSKKNDFQAKLDAVLVSPPVSYYGKIDGFDLVDESYLPGSDRYFRFVYISYHEGAPLLWEFRFYVKKDGAPTLHFITWSEANPFEYMSTSDMLLPRWYHD